MDLIIDLGNTNFKAAVIKDKKIISLDIVPKNRENKLLQDISNTKYDGAIISSVVQVPVELTRLLKMNTHYFIVLDSKTKIPLVNLYKTPETLGSDRIALAVGGHSLANGANVLVIDTGSCITYDFVSSESEYSGGSISPGTDMRLNALNTLTGKLPLIRKREFAGLTGKTTEESILSGVLNGVTFEIQGFIDHYNKLYSDLKVILTGGDSIFFANQLKNCTFAEPNLLLYGLQEILSFNRS